VEAAHSEALVVGENAQRGVASGCIGRRLSSRTNGRREEDDGTQRPQQLAVAGTVAAVGVATCRVERGLEQSGSECKKGGIAWRMLWRGEVSWA
jgi:hypothetical protein